MLCWLWNERPRGRELTESYSVGCRVGVVVFALVFALVFVLITGHFSPSLPSALLGAPTQTTRHLAEFWMIEPEMAFAQLSDVQVDDG